MNRRRFLELLGMAAAGTGIVYSFPSIIVPKNIAPSTDYTSAPKGLGYLLSDTSRVLQGIDSMWVYPALYALPLSLKGDSLIVSREMRVASGVRAISECWKLS